MNQVLSVILGSRCLRTSNFPSMKASQIISMAGLAAVSLGQTPPGFSPSVEEKLEVTFGSKTVSTPGVAFTKIGEHGEFKSRRLT